LARATKEGFAALRRCGLVGIGGVRARAPRGLALQVKGCGIMIAADALVRVMIYVVEDLVPWASLSCWWLGVQWRVLQLSTLSSPD
jgi:hypothetical protein